MLSFSLSGWLFTPSITGARYHQNIPCKSFHVLPLFSLSQRSTFLPPSGFSLQQTPPFFSSSDTQKEEEGEGQKLRWDEIGPDIIEPQKYAISQLPPKMPKRCKALLRCLICFTPQPDRDLSLLLSTWVKIMKPRRADWLAVLKEMRRQEIPLLLEVTEWALLEESFEANIRDYTKLIDAYGKQNRLEDAEKALAAMKKRGFALDHVSLTVMIHMYSKAGQLTLAEEIFEEIKLLGLPLDKKAYESMIMAYIRAGMTELGESLLREMEAQEIYAGREVYKALLRAYSTAGNTDGAERVFGAIQFAGNVPDARLCALLMNAYYVTGQSDKVRSVLENLRRVRIEPSDKCVGLMLAAYEKEGNLTKALDLLMDLEKDGLVLGKEASDVLAKWFRRLGVVDEVEHVLRGYAESKGKYKMPSHVS